MINFPNNCGVATVTRERGEVEQMQRVLHIQAKVNSSVWRK